MKQLVFYCKIKNMTMKCLITAFAFSVLSFSGYSQSEQLAINLTQKSIPGKLTFENPKGSIKVTGYEGEIILVTGTLRYPDVEKTDGNGLRKIDQNLLDISAEVNGNNV